MSYSTINLSLTALNDAIKQAMQHIQRLSKLQPHSSPPSGTSSPAQGSSSYAGVESSDDVRADLSAEIHESLKQQEEQLELLKQDVEDVILPDGDRRRGSMVGLDGESERDSARLSARCIRLSEDLRIARNRFRKAQLQAKHTFDLAAQNDRIAYLASLQAAAAASSLPLQSDSPGLDEPTTRAALFANRRGPRNKDPNFTQSDLLLTATSDVTSSLRRTHNLLTSELSRSRFAQDTLETSNAALNELTARYTSLDDLLKKSRGLLGTLLRSNKSDTWYLETAFYMLLATIAWLIFRRFLYGPLWWLVWFPAKLFWRVSFSVVGGIGGLLLPATGLMRSRIGPSTTILASTRTALTVMPSATGRPPRFSDTIPQYVSVAAEGDGAKEMSKRRKLSERSPQGTLSDLVGRMVEAASVMNEQHTALQDTIQTVVQMTMQTEVQGTVRPLGTQRPVQHQQQGEEDEMEIEPDNKSEQQQARAAQNQQQQQQQQQQQPQVVRRADGQALRERDEATEPRNPKKRVFEEPPPGEEQQREL